MTSDGKVTMTPEVEAAEVREFFGQFARFIVKHYGERCPEVEGGCATCSMWALHDLARAMVCEP